MSHLNPSPILPLAGLLLAGLSTFAAQAAEPASPYYAGLHLGAHGHDDWPASVDFGGVRSQGQLSLRSNLHAGLLLGRQRERARFELEWQHGVLPVRSVTLGPIQQAAGQRGHYDALTLNALYQVPFSGPWSGLLGGGLGWGRAVLPAVPFDNGCQCVAAAQRSGASYQLRLGAAYQADARWQGQVSLNWLHLGGPRAAGKTSITYASRGIPSVSAGVLFPF
jgi:opacity protein-like surface antigen